MNQLSCKLLLTKELPIFEQLQLEEALFRASTDNWCICNFQSPPAIVLGISNLPQEMIDLSQPDLPPIIKRFSGGGTVIVDQNTVFFTIILNRHELPSLSCPQSLMSWTHSLLAPAFLPKMLQLHDHDFSIDDQKVGGNAQSFSKDRILHHISFLWSWDQERMSLLHIPSRQPSYRKGRSHHHFCHKLASFFPTKHDLVQALISCVEQKFQTISVSLQEAQGFLQKPHRKALSVVNIANL
jgi:lipoate-protein ligase A